MVTIFYAFAGRLMDDPQEAGTVSLLTHINYFAVVLLMVAGLYVVFSSSNLIRRMIGLALFQTSTGLFYISLAKVAGGTAPIRVEPGSATARELSQQARSRLCRAIRGRRRRLFEPAAARPHPHRHRGRRRDAGGRSRHRCARPRGLRHDRGRRGRRASTGKAGAAQEPAA